MFSKLLVANRGEIAVRIIRACKEMGIISVAVYSEADAGALHTTLADESYCIGRAPAAESYLNADSIIGAALASGAQAIHPGYGFLSENARFAERCRENGLVFIGPSVENMRALGDKEQVKARMEQAGLPVIPGTGILGTLPEAAEAAEKIGCPVMLKARAGGGGRGIRLVKDGTELEKAYLSAAAEGMAAFGDGAVYLEKYISPAKHIELQILADQYGHAVCLGERDCSLQQRNQKLIEESPSPAVTEALRRRMTEQAVEAVKQLGYSGVGTLEFLLDGAGNYYFMEMNVRLQVEHAVTECLTGIDLVKWQIRVSAGIPLNFSQQDVSLKGSSIECRINALAPGTVEFLHVPGGPFVRFDSFLFTGAYVPPQYDSLIGKLIVLAGTREEAIRKMKAALCELVIEGVPNNTKEQIDRIGSDAFLRGDYLLGLIGT